VKPLSQPLTQSSSSPLHVSLGGVQLPHVQSPAHVRDPVEPHAVAHPSTASLQHAKPLSQPLTQSSSSPLHASSGGVHTPHEQSSAHVRDPVDPHAVVHPSTASLQHAKPSSQPFAQSSSTPLQVSAGGAHASQSQLAEQVSTPVVPHPVVQPRVASLQHGNASSQPSTQSSSSPLQTSTAVAPPGHATAFGPSHAYVSSRHSSPSDPSHALPTAGESAHTPPHAFPPSSVDMSQSSSSLLQVSSLAAVPPMHGPQAPAVQVCDPATHAPASLPQG
jgi:hypothetical protein